METVHGIVEFRLEFCFNWVWEGYALLNYAPGIKILEISFLTCPKFQVAKKQDSKI